MTLQHLRTLLDYHFWARDRMLAAAEALTPEQFTRDMGSSFRSVRDTLVHIYSAEWAWCSRWQGTSPAAHLPPEQFPDVGSLRQAWTEQETKMRAVLEELGEPGIEKVIEYKLLNGTAGASVFWHMLQHVVNHASYHRGQVTTMLRQLGAPPAKGMDMIAFYRERSNAGARA
jgi:uncharacterized damage-inducible protein DinB